jgi:serine/threonine-protein kinase
MVGTLPFLSPEQFKGEGPVDHRADLWALAVVAYRCVTGTFPFQGQTSGLLCLSVCTGAFVRPRSLRNDAPIGMDEWFGKAFNQDPAQRFQSAKEMALAFVRIVPASAEDFGEELLSGIHLAPPGLESGPGGPGGLDTTPSTVLPALAPRRTRKRALQPLTIALLGGGLAIVAAAGLVLARTSGARATAAGADGRSESQASGASRAADSSSSADSEVNSGADGGAESPEASGSAAPAATGTAGAQAVPKGFLPAARGSAGKKGRRAHPTGEDYGF